MFWPLLEGAMSKKCTPLRREAHFEVKMIKTPWVRTTFGRSDAVSRGRRRGLWTLSKGSKTRGFCSISKNDGKHGTFEEDLQKICKDAFSVAGTIQETCSSELLGGPGGLRSSGLLRWFCVTGAALRMTWHHFFRARRSSLDRWTRKIAKRIGTRPTALHSTFHFWRKSRRIVSFLMLST